jgi:hypothetical protein
MTAMCDPVSTIDLLAAANRTVDEHWRRPGQPWRPVCADCTADGCPQMKSAEMFLAQVRRRALS